MIAPVETPVRRDPPQRRNALVTDDIVRLLRADRGAWYLIARRANHASYYYHAKRPVDIELRVKYLSDETGRRYSEVYARCRG